MKADHEKNVRDAQKRARDRGLVAFEKDYDICIEYLPLKKSPGLYY